MLFPSLKSSKILKPAIPSTFPAERITENILALSDMAVLLTQGSQNISYCSKSIFSLLGFNHEKIMSDGWPYLFQQIHPQDQKTLKKELLPALRKYLKKYPIEGKESLTFNYTLRMRHVRGHYLLVAIENQPLEWQGKRWPELYMSVLKNITPFGNNHKMILTIVQRQDNKRYATVHRQEFNFRCDLFTLREIEIMRLVVEGLTSKQIGERLYISPETVRNHRKKILLKSRCASSSELAAFAVREGIL